MNKFASFTAALVFAFAGSAFASGGPDLRLDPAPVHRLDTESLQRGARNFVNYCMGCHSAKFMRYEGLTGIGLTEQQIRDNLMFGTDKLGSTMTIAMTPDQARNWFGAIPPDLSRHRARARQRLALQLLPVVLQGRQVGHRLEQPRVPQRRHAARAVAVVGPAAARHAGVRQPREGARRHDRAEGPGSARARHRRQVVRADRRAGSRRARARSRPWSTRPSPPIS